MRLFIALPLSDDVEQFLGGIILDLKQKRGRVKWVASKNIHLTMKFLGETDENKVEAIIESIRSAASRIFVGHGLSGPGLKKRKIISTGWRRLRRISKKR